MELKPQSINFCHISPTEYLPHFCVNRPFHLVLAHLIEQDDLYTEFYVQEKQRHDTCIIMDNSAFEMYKQGREMYPSGKLIEMGSKIQADYIVMSDYPGQASQVTIDKAIEMAPEIKAAGFGTFFVPQSEEGDLEDYLSAYEWAAENPELVDYIGVSILGAPLAYGVEKGNKLQRYFARYKVMVELEKRGILERFFVNGQKIHMLGMVDGPNEVELMYMFHSDIDTWDSSAAVWLGLHGRTFDQSPTGLIDGKFEKEVDFNHPLEDNPLNMQCVYDNIDYIDVLCEGGN